MTIDQFNMQWKKIEKFLDPITAQSRGSQILSVENFSHSRTNLLLNKLLISISHATGILVPQNCFIY